jgi:hypothetical protein
VGHGLPEEGLLVGAGDNRDVRVRVVLAAVQVLEYLAVWHAGQDGVEVELGRGGGGAGGGVDVSEDEAWELQVLERGGGRRRGLGL